MAADLYLAPAPAAADDDAEEWADIGYTRISDDRTGVAASPARQKRAIIARPPPTGRHAITTGSRTSPSRRSGPA